MKVNEIKSKIEELEEKKVEINRCIKQLKEELIEKELKSLFPLRCEKDAKIITLKCTSDIVVIPNQKCITVSDKNGNYIIMIPYERSDTNFPSLSYVQAFSMATEIKNHLNKWAGSLIE